MTVHANLALRLKNMAHRSPDKDALRFASKKTGGRFHYDSLTFSQLTEQIERISFALKEQDIQTGDRVAVFIRPSLDFTPLIFSLFQIGAIPVFIDPGMGRKNLLQAVAQVSPRVMISENILHYLRRLWPKSFRSIEIYISRFHSPLLKIPSLEKMKEQNQLNQNYEQLDPNGPSAILFTSGGTGIPKGVVYTNKIFNAQIDELQSMFSLSQDDIDLPAFPLFGLFTTIMGMTSCIPNMNPAKPAKCNPQALVKNITNNQATFVAGSPAIWQRVGEYLQKNHLTLPSVKYLVMFGAPIGPQMHSLYREILPNGSTYTPYGATECLPVSLASAQELENTTTVGQNGEGICIGRPTASNEVKIIRPSRQIIPTSQDMEILPINEIGEIVVKGPFVTPCYFEMEAQTQLAKITDGPSHWHRMGDFGKIDEHNRLWFYGRVGHQVELDLPAPLYSIPCEAIFNRHPKVKRCALIGPRRVGRIIPAIVVELSTKKVDLEQLKRELEDMAEEHEHTKRIKTFYIHPSLPVDVRHNIKIDRSKLKFMAEYRKLQRM